MTTKPDKSPAARAQKFDLILAELENLTVEQFDHDQSTSGADHEDDRSCCRRANAARLAARKKAHAALDEAIREAATCTRVHFTDALLAPLLRAEKVRVLEEVEEALDADPDCPAFAGRAVRRMLSSARAEKP